MNSLLQEMGVGFQEPSTGKNGTVMRICQAAATALLLFLSVSPVYPEETESAAPAKRTPIFTEEGAEACLRCHSGEKMRAIASNVHGNADNPHTPASAQACEACHGPGSIHASRAHGGRGFPPLTTFGRGSDVSPRDEQLQACLGCHSGAGTGRAHIGFFGSVHDRRTINCSTCHQVHVETDPITDKDQQATTCFRCHRRQREEHPRFEGKSINFDALSCSTCHDVHLASLPEE
jgi:DmsE family decaheme c-type cytochrome